MQISGQFLVTATKLNITKYINVGIFIAMHIQMQKSLFAKLQLLIL